MYLGFATGDKEITRSFRELTNHYGARNRHHCVQDGKQQAEMRRKIAIAGQSVSDVILIRSFLILEIYVLYSTPQASNLDVQSWSVSHHTVEPLSMRPSGPEHLFQQHLTGWDDL